MTTPNTMIEEKIKKWFEDKKITDEAMALMGLTYHGDWEWALDEETFSKFLRSALLEVHNATVRECQMALPKEQKENDVDDLESSCNKVGFNAAIYQSHQVLEKLIIK